MEVIRHVVHDQLGLSIPVAGLAKDGHHRTSELLTYVDGEIMTVGVDIKSALFQFLTRIQDEVHRYAIQFHRDRRSKHQVASELDSIRGVGDVTKKALLKHFKSVKRIREASLGQLEAVVGKAKAATIHAALNQEDQEA
jgi:excinuclease ABC subunit C